MQSSGSSWWSTTLSRFRMGYRYTSLSDEPQPRKPRLDLYRRLMFVMFVMIAALLLSALFGNPKGGYAAATLRFSNRGTFQLSVFEDLHYGEAENLDWGPQQDINSTRVMNSILDEEQPQLVVLNGDLITGENTFKENSTHYVDRIVAPLVARKLLWASTYGNHDSDFNLSRPALFEREKRYANSLTQNMVPSKDDAFGISNYYLPVYSSDKSNRIPKLILWFFDSRGGSYYQKLDAAGNTIGIPGWVDPAVATWLRSTSAYLNAKHGTTIPSLAFVHIPVNAFLAFQDMGVDANKEPGINDDVPLAQQGLSSGQGGSDTNYVYTGEDIPFMDALLHTEGLMAVFSAHDHGDDWCFKWDSKLPGMNLTGNGINLCFGRHSGYGGYGTWTRGARQILIDEKTVGKLVETWVRLEDGSVSGRVTLNSTYGRDNYPAVNS